MLRAASSSFRFAAAIAGLAISQSAEARITSLTAACASCMTRVSTSTSRLWSPMVLVFGSSFDFVHPPSISTGSSSAAGASIRRVFI